MDPNVEVMTVCGRGSPAEADDMLVASPEKGTTAVVEIGTSIFRPSVVDEAIERPFRVVETTFSAESNIPKTCDTLPRGTRMPLASCRDSAVLAGRTASKSGSEIDR